MAPQLGVAGMPLPKQPIIFDKTPTCICGPNNDIVIPKDSSKLDYEAELGIVIGKRARYIASEQEAPIFIAGCGGVQEVTAAVSENRPRPEREAPGS